MPYQSERNRRQNSPYKCIVKELESNTVPQIAVHMARVRIVIYESLELSCTRSITSLQYKYYSVRYCTVVHVYSRSLVL